MVCATSFSGKCVVKSATRKPPPASIITTCSVWLFSARYSGEGHSDEQNRKKLLLEMKDVSDRRAKFVSVITLIDENGDVFVGTGETKGEITREEKGNNGFGYDSLFFSYDLQKTFGQASDEDKNEVSHRSRALADLTKKLWYYKK